MHTLPGAPSGVTAYEHAGFAGSSSAGDHDTGAFEPYPWRRCSSCG